MNHFKIFQKIAILALLLVGVSVNKAQAQACPSADEVTVTVLADPTITSLAASISTVCSGGSTVLTATVPSGYGSPICTDFTWGSRPAGSGGAFTTISGQTGSTYTPTGLTANTEYQVTWNCSTALACTSPTATVTVTVVPDISETTPPANITQCVDVSAAGTALTVVVANGTGNYIYEWFESPDGTSKPTTGTVLQTATTASTSNSYTPVRTLADVGVRYYFVRVRSSAASGADCGELLSSIATVDNRAPLTSSGGTFTLAECVDGTGTISAPTISGGSGSYNYAWTVDNGSGTFVAITSEATAVSSTVIRPTSTSAVTRTFRLSITDAAGSSVLCNTLGPLDYTVTISNKPVVSISSSLAQTVCDGGGVVLNASLAGGSGTCTITWQYRASSAGVYSDITGAQGTAVQTGSGPGSTSQFTSVPLTGGTAPQYRAKVTCSDNGCCQ